MADTESTASSKSHLASVFGLVWIILRISLGGVMALLAMGGAGLIAAVIAAAVGYFFGNQLVAALAALVFSAGAKITQLAGGLFNFFIEHLVIRYSSTLQDLQIMNGIDLVWSAFRDLANIAIIALFVFIAINIILGVKQFGEKKMIAKVLVVAVLINFSLLFTKVIIDAANFTAYQFYRSAGLENVAGLASSPNGAGGASTPGGIADAFLNTVGITSIGDTARGVNALAGTEGITTAFVFTVFATLLLFVMVGLFLYAAFQIVVRSILLVFLMITSPLAFVSWLVPNSTIGENWKKWWESLIGAAFFAPFLMIALWASMLLLRRAAQARGGATLGEFFTNPTLNAQSWTLILVYCFAAGLLYASIKLASTFANSIAGFKLAAVGPALGIAALARIGGFAGRHTFGYAADRTADKYKDLSARLRVENRPLQAKAIDRLARRPLERASQRDFNFMNTILGKEVSKAAGLGEKFATTDYGGYKKIKDEMARQYAETGQRMQLSDIQKSNILASAAAAAAAQHAPEQRGAEAKHKKAVDDRDATEPAREREIATQTATQKTAESRKRAIEEETARSLETLRSELSTAASNREKEQITKSIRAKESEQRELMRGEEAKIERTKREIDRIRAEAEEPVKRAAEALEKVGKDIEKTTTDIVKARYPNIEEVVKGKDGKLTIRDQSVADIAARQANLRFTNLYGALSPERDDRTAQLARKHARETAQEKRLKKIFSQQIGKEEKKPEAEEKSDEDSDKQQ